MKKVTISVIGLSLLLISCESKTGTGAIVGAGTGALAGGLIGGGKGALIGGAIGTGAGALIGYGMDQNDREVMEQNSPQTMKRIDRGQPLTVDDVKQMSRNGLSDDVIINQIKATNTHYHLSTAEIVDLKNSGVSQRVIDYMIQSGQGY
jgi:outer membrane lipoprotein SlyB